MKVAGYCGVKIQGDSMSIEKIGYKAQSFVELDHDEYFTLQNLPYGVFKRKGADRKHLGVAIGELILDLTALEQAAFVSFAKSPIFQHETLNHFASQPAELQKQVRSVLTHLLHRDTGTLRDNQKARSQFLVEQNEVEMQAPFVTTGFTDFYASKCHAENVGALFRANEAALLPNWHTIPIAYNGRSSTIRVSGQPVIRPWGMILNPETGEPHYRPTQKLDFELEMGAFVGRGTRLGESLNCDSARDSIFGFVLVNDWSARDIQAWEYRPLGPFNGKSFLTSISPWVVTVDALAPFRTADHAYSPTLPVYLKHSMKNYDVKLEVYLGQKGELKRVTESNLKHLFWTFEQMLAHHTSNGCEMRVGDLLASGTISGPQKGTLGCLLEITQNGKVPLEGFDGKGFLEDGMEVVMKGYCENENGRIGFGNVSGTIMSSAK